MSAIEKTPKLQSVTITARLADDMSNFHNGVITDEIAHQSFQSAAQKIDRRKSSISWGLRRQYSWMEGTTDCPNANQPSISPYLDPANVTTTSYTSPAINANTDDNGGGVDYTPLPDQENSPKEPPLPPFLAETRVSSFMSSFSRISKVMNNIQDRRRCAVSVAPSLLLRNCSSNYNRIKNTPSRPHYIVFEVTNGGKGFAKVNSSPLFLLF